MLTYDRYIEILEKLIDELPEIFFQKLNLGVTVSDEMKIHPLSRDGELYILGEYLMEGSLGCGIVMYFTPFEVRYGMLSDEDAEIKLRHVLRHEFRHHLEFLAGEYGLIDEDIKKLSLYLENE
jgi:hypothetical protein